MNRADFLTQEERDKIARAYCKLMIAEWDEEVLGAKPKDFDRSTYLNYWAQMHENFEELVGEEYLKFYHAAIFCDGMSRERWIRYKLLGDAVEMIIEAEGST